MQRNLPNTSVAVTVVAGSPSATELTTTGAAATATARAGRTVNVAVLTGLCSSLARALRYGISDDAYRECGWGDGPDGGHRHASRRGCSANQLQQEVHVSSLHLLAISSHPNPPIKLRHQMPQSSSSRLSKLSSNLPRAHLLGYHVPASALPRTSCLPPRPPAAGRGVSRAGPSAPALRLPARCTGLSMTLVGGSGSLLGSSSGSLPFGIRVSGGGPKLSRRRLEQSLVLSLSQRRARGRARPVGGW